MLRHYVKFFLQGSYITEETSPIEISIRDIKKIRIPKGTIGIELFDRIDNKKTNIEKYYVGEFVPVSEFEESSFAHFQLVSDNCIGIIRCAGANSFKIKNNENFSILTQDEIDKNNLRLENLGHLDETEKE